MKKSISRNLNIRLNIIILVTGLIAGSIYYYISIREAEGKLSKYINTATNHFAESISIRLWNIDDHTIGLLSRQLLKLRDVTGVRVFDEKNHIIFEKGRFAGTDLRISTKDIHYQGILVGHLEIIFTNARLWENKEDILVVTLMIVLCILLSCFVLMRLVLKRFLIMPLRKLKESIDQFSIGQFKTPLPSNQQVEIQNILDSFNDLSRKLNEREQDVREKTRSLEEINVELNDEIKERKKAEVALQKAHDELESKVDERTLELREVNEQLKIKIDEHMKLHDQLIRSERLAATGQLAVSVAHEINSPLQAVTSMLNTLKKTHKEDKKLLDNIDLLKRSFGNIRDTVKHLLDLNRPDKGRKQSANINKIIEDTVRLVRSHLKSSGIKLNLSLSSSVPDISVLTQQMSQVFLNLINNAVEAVTGRLRPKDKGDLKSKTSIGGEITVKTDYSERDIILTVSDNGSGILEEDLEHIFDPFYTRKKQLGMGIGLSICHDIIEDHNGTIEAKNSEEGGAVITITLPVSKK